MRRFLSKTMIFLGVLSLALGTLNTFSYNITYAEDLELVGTNLGLEVIPTSTKLLDLQNLNPGDSNEGKITIKNNYVAPFNLYMRAERISPLPDIEDVDLLDQLLLTIYLKGNTVYSGPMKDFATSNIFVGVFDPNDIEDLRAVVHLPGPVTGNEFQGKSVDVKWIFTATSEGPPIPPEEPEVPDEPDEPEVPDEPDEPEVPDIPEEAIEEEIPEAVPEEIIEEVPEAVPEEIIEKEIMEEEIPQAVPKMPKTGELSSVVFYGAGMLFLLMGIELGFKKKN